MIWLSIRIHGWGKTRHADLLTLCLGLGLSCRRSGGPRYLFVASSGSLQLDAYSEKSVDCGTTALTLQARYIIPPDVSMVLYNGLRIELFL